MVFRKIISRIYHQSDKQFGSGSGRTFVRPDLGPNCLQRLSADELVGKELKACFFCRNSVVHAA